MYEYYEEQKHKATNSDDTDALDEDAWEPYEDEAEDIEDFL